VAKKLIAYPPICCDGKYLATVGSACCESSP
jgi:hypothetical protein